MNETINTLTNLSLNDVLNQATFVLDKLHFLRADWFYAFIPLLLFLVLMRNRTQSDKNWHSVIDRELLPFVLTRGGHKRRTYPLLITFIAASLCITALAGPVYKKLPQPVYREQSSLVILLDLSQSMNAADIKPSRLYRAKLELLDILKTRKTGQTALVVYAAEAFVVTPLTDDNETIANLVPALETDMMPAQGSNLSAALAKTVSLFNQAGVVKGDILVITDDIHDSDKAAISKTRAQGFRISIFGIGTSAGGPVPLQDTSSGGFLLDSDGAIIVPKMQSSRLQSYALAGGGIYTGIRADDSDTRKLNRLFQSAEISNDITKSDSNADVWQEEGHWLLLPLLLLAAFWARKGWIAALLPFVISLTISLPQPVYAQDTATAAEQQDTGLIDLDHLWFSPDQKAMRAFKDGDTENAASEFSRPDWKASAYYKSDDYASALKSMQSPTDSDDFYNKANTLAKLGRYQDAIKAYDQAIELNEDNADAKYNREQVKKALEKQQQNSRQQNSEQDNSQQNQSEQNQDNSEQQNSEQSSTDQPQDQQQQNQQSQNQEQSGQQQKDQQNQQQQQENDQSAEDSQNAAKQEAANNMSEEQKQQQEEKQLKNRNAEAEAEKEQQEKQQYEQQQKEQQENKAENQANNQPDNQQIENREGNEKPAEVEINPQEASITEQEKATEQWLKRIPDDPGGLLRRKFLYQYSQMPGQHDDREPW